ncbi:MAG: VWA domain-containing protein [Eubacteriaceae bacterium]|nr:VWA domain-containing protein [Eubacteriaceae bacterium]
MAGQGFECNADLVLCIDATGSMEPIIDEVKSSATSFYDRITDALQEKERYVKNFRIKIIVFRDYYCDGDMAMNESKFFSLPQETEDFYDFVSEISAGGGGDEPENALEAIALAMDSDWVQEGTRRRHIIMVWTDASAHPLEKSFEGKPAIYPEGIPTSFMGLGDWWADRQSGKMNQSAKRLIVFAPDDSPWSEIALWENTVHIPSKAGAGMDETDMDMVIKTLAGSV